MLDHWLRELKERLLYYVAAPFYDIHPNAITLVAFMCGLLAVYAASIGELGWTMAGWAANRTLDGLDGVVARRFGKQTDFGGYLDIVLDFVIYALIPIALVVGASTPTRWLIVSLLQAVYFVNAGGLFLLAAIIEKHERTSKELTTVAMPSGLIEGSETVIFYTMFILLPSNMELLFSVFATLVLVTVLQRLLWAYKHLPHLKATSKVEIKALEKAATKKTK